VAAAAVRTATLAPLDDASIAAIVDSALAASPPGLGAAIRAAPVGRR